MNEQTRREASRREKVALVCPACGAAARRENARFCATCGRGLKDSFYAPADSLLASYYQQHSRPAMLFEPATNGARSQTPTPHWKIFADEGNSSAAIALVLVCSALVPFIGILFCPFAMMMGCYGLLEARFAPRTGGARLAVCCIVFAVLIAGAQVLLWRLF